MVASSTAGRAGAPPGRTPDRSAVGMKMVRSPRSSEKKASAITLPGAPVVATPWAARVDESSPSAPWNQGPRSLRLTASVMAALSSGGSLRCSMRSVGDGTLEQVPKGGDRLLGLEETLLQPGQVRGDQLVAGVDVGRLEDGPDLLQWHVEIRNRRMTCAVGICSVL